MDYMDGAEPRQAAPREKSLSIKHIARLSSVSTATVSRTLSHPERVLETTRQARDGGGRPARLSGELHSPQPAASTRQFDARHYAGSRQPVLLGDLRRVAGDAFGAGHRPARR
ncbi:hypothetical protein CJ301_13075 [Limimaricola cinnabarinus]|uniref:HTH lacI-type domain-containing protein n=1 Tax=Limimaricola cinnabarinus TaxID=1125964 RepID=A0A2G1MEA7_9RHOB|nr:hypothetical protein CJ301_13075 [Limimaricola cinnabarinus]